MIDAAVVAAAARNGVAVSLPSAAGGGGGVVDSAALGEFAEQVTGRDGVLASAARLVLGQLGLDTPVTAPESTNDAELIDLVTAELGSDWPRLVAPAFDAKKAVVFDDRWASAREDLVKLWLSDEGDIHADRPRLSERFEGAGHVVATQANWWQGKALAAGRNVHASLFGRIAAGAENPGAGRYSDEVAVVTGASKGVDRASVVAQLLEGGATVIATTSRLDDDRLAFYKRFTATTRASARRCGWYPPTWLPTPISTHWSSGSAPSRRKTLGRSRFTSRTRKRPRSCSRSRRRGWRATCPKPERARRWR